MQTEIVGYFIDFGKAAHPLPVRKGSELFTQWTSKSWQAGSKPENLVPRGYVWLPGEGWPPFTYRPNQLAFQHRFLFDIVALQWLQIPRPLALQKAAADQRTVDDGSNRDSDGVQL